jgi:hypothetical protein
MKALSLSMSLLLTGLGLAGCGEEVRVNVACVTVATPAVECTVTQTQGKGEVEACWDFTATCANGVAVKAARTCQKVKNGGTEKAIIPADKLADVDKCAGDKPPTAKVENLTLNGQAAK